MLFLFSVVESVARGANEANEANESSKLTFEASTFVVAGASSVLMDSSFTVVVLDRLGILLEVSNFVDGSSGHSWQDDVGKPSAVACKGLLMTVVLDLFDAFLGVPDVLLFPKVTNAKPSFDMSRVCSSLILVLELPPICFLGSLLDGSEA